MRCPECHQTNVPGALFCERCGADLPETSAPPDREPAAPPAAVPANAEAGESQAVAPPPAAPAEPVAEPVETRRCPRCGHDNDLAFQVCEACGRSLTEPVPTPLPAPPPPPPPPVPAPVAEPATAPTDEPIRRVETSLPPPAPPRSPPGAGGPTPGQLITGPRMGKVKLVVEQGMVVGREYLLNEPEMLVGREDAAEQVFPSIDLTGLDEGYVHRLHAKLTFEGTFLFVTHLGGHNRTYVNNRPIADHLAHPVNIGDTVRFGKVLLRLVEA